MTTIDINSLRKRGAIFAKNYANAHYELGQAQSFVSEFCQLFGLNPYRLINFES